MSLSKSQAQALKSCLNTNDNVFVQGSAGTGKNYMLDMFKKLAPEKNIRYQIVTPTGVSAVNAGGITIHSFFGIKGTPDLAKHEFKKMDIKFNVLVIDEISMVNKECMLIMDKTLRMSLDETKPMGGIRVIALGDFHQLPPTTANGCESIIYGSTLWNLLNFVQKDLFLNIRVNDQKQSAILKLIRKGIETDEVKEFMNSKLITEKESTEDKYNDFIHLFWSNKQCNKYNDFRLKHLDGIERTYEIISTENVARNILTLKVGARVMCIKNLYRDGIMNGECGYVKELKDKSVIAIMDNGKAVEFEYEVWMANRNGVDEVIMQRIPLQLAWAMTISKSQGLTLDKVVLYVKPNLHPGLAYVGISRVRNMDNFKIVGYAPGKNIFQSPTGLNGSNS